MFRKKALAKLNNPSDLNSLFLPINVKMSIVIIINIILVMSLAWWCFFDTIPYTIDAQGIIIPKGGVKTIQSPYEGEITSIFLKRGQKFKEGDYFASIKTGGNNKIIKSIISGHIVEVSASDGQIINRGDNILEVVNEGDDLVAYVYVNAELGKLIKSSMNVWLEPSFLSSSKYGYLQGVVQSISEIPASKSLMERRLGDSSFINSFSDGMPVLEVVISLKKGDTVSGFSWTLGQGPSFLITGGTITQAKIIIRQISPISFLFGT